MRPSDNAIRFDTLRTEYERFTFQRYDFNLDKGDLHISFTFSLDHIVFHPKLHIPARSFYNWHSISKDELDTLVFHIGMVELISYWKLACPKKVIIKPFVLTERQIIWWKKLYYNGLGEFFYLNNIKVSFEDFMNIECQSTSTFSRVSIPVTERVMVPIGGGKDSAVTLELVKDELGCIPMIINPRGATLDTIAAGGYSLDDSAIVQRHLDPLMLKMNQEGFLNGHTPFSALLAFVSILLGLTCRCRYIALSNESSANESTVPGTNINHQYSKSIEFEADFRDYVADNIHDNIQYFSFLRPLNELQIASLLSRFDAYHYIFRSCNVGSKTDIWCGTCPKCLFTYLILSPFLSREKLSEIFGKDMLCDESLRHILRELDGRSAVKPFECVGTIEEVRACESYLINTIAQPEHTILDDATPSDTSIEELLKQFNERHFLPPVFLNIMKGALHV